MRSSRVGATTRRGRRGGRAFALGLLATAVAALAVVSAAGAAQTPPTLGGAPAGDVNAKQLPLGASNAPTTVVVQLAGNPVSVVDADASSPLTRDERRALRDQLRSRQAPVEDRIRQLGGTVLNSYQSAYNGIKVRIAAREASQLATLPDVVAVHPLQLMRPANVHGVPLIGAPQVWGGLGNLHGEGIKIGIIDTGIDYTHADFGGPGTPGAYQTALEHDTADPTQTDVCMTPELTPCFGPQAPKVKGGIDLVGDDYNADPTSPSYQPVPHPDPNPLDCYGHGSHVAGTAAGFGVLSDGSTYTGPYDAATVSASSWNVGPGVAPGAELYAIRIFGCQGATDETLDGIEWAVENGMDVINLSLGSPFGSADDPAAVAADNAAKDGVIVVSSSGNEGSNPYMTSTPASGTGAISVAASDPTETFPGVDLALPGGGTTSAINANDAPVTDATTLPVEVLWTDPSAPHTLANVSLGCDPNDYAGVSGALVVTQRGSCARVARAIFGQAAGAKAVLMINSTDAYPPFEGAITGNPDTGEPATVTIPFLGAPSSAAGALLAADGGNATLTNTQIVNPGYLGLADFSSFGPRSGDSGLKPNVTAPGVSIASVGMGTGNQATIMSGTSMASPFTAGTAALVKQAHPDWRRVEDWEAAIENTADPGQVVGYATTGAGTGLIQAQAATRTDVVALGDRHSATLNFGFNELDRDFSRVGDIRLRNLGGSPTSFTVSAGSDQGQPHTVELSDSSVTVPPHGERDVHVRLTVPAATAGSGSYPGLPGSTFAEVSGLVTFSPSGGSNNGVTLRVPYFMVPQAVSHVDVRLGDGRSWGFHNTRPGDQAHGDQGPQVGQDGQNARGRRGGAPDTLIATLSNRNGAVPGTADWYAWGLHDTRDPGLGSDDLRDAGVQSFPSDGILVFALSTAHRWSNAVQNEFDVYVDVNNDGTPDYDVFSDDYGAITSGDFDGIDATFVLTLATGQISFAGYLADAPTDSSTILLPVLFSQLCRAGQPCLDSGNPRFTYAVQSFGLTDNTSDTIPGSASFNAFSPAVSTGMSDSLPPDGTATEQLSIDQSEFAQTPALGWMVVSHSNPTADEATLLPVHIRRQQQHGRRQDGRRH